MRPHALRLLRRSSPLFARASRLESPAPFAAFASSYTRPVASKQTSTPKSKAAAAPAPLSFPDPQPAATPVATPAEVTSPAYSPVPEPAPAPAPGSNGNGEEAIDWSSSFYGLGTTPFPPEVAAVLMGPLNPEDVEIKPDGIIYLPEIKYRRILNQAFGPGGWGLAPRGEVAVGEKVVTREYALVVHGRFIAQARGECQYFSPDTIATAGEGCKSNALLRCCKDLGIASELWDPRFIREFKKKYCQELWVEHNLTKKKRQIWLRKGDEPTYPFKKV
ncbi:hypothetical protein NKR23_g7253 [Pleurostoma richardsiae]|uniref:Mitochondrial genome maintenance protein MGM101 n=1 Tax=Pleurostoma richardsiae TaxID=41990 RepID=A0AA38RWM5_9PEZI|nr:hypothetical protein NKR23_g7253 [Pleurostoma richardsiae]